jgi:hypothetical protein
VAYFLGSVTAIVGLTTFIVGQLKPYVAGINTLNKIPVFVYSLAVSLLLTLLAIFVTHTIQGTAADIIIAVILQVLGATKADSPLQTMGDSADSAATPITKGAATSPPPASPSTPGSGTVASLILAVAIGALLCGTPGCGLIPVPVDPNADAVVVNAQRVEQAAFDSIDAFVQLDNDNRDELSKNLPAVHALAEQLRKTVPGLIDQYNAALDAYRAAKTPANSDTVNNLATQIQALAAQARAALLQIPTTQPTKGN